MENISQDVVLPPLPSEPDGLITFGSYRSEEERSNVGRIKRRQPRFGSDIKFYMTTIKEKRLLEAVRLNDIDKVRLLLDEGVSPNAKDTFKRSALHIATSQNFIDLVRLLLEYGANPNQLDSIGNTPLHLASCTRHLEVVTLLIKHGASTLVTDGNGLHPLAIAYSKLKHCERYKPLCMTNEELRKYHETIVNVYNVILHHFDVQKSEAEYNDFKNMEEKFKGLNTKEEIDNEVSSLLESFEKFSFKARSAQSSRNS